MSLPFISIITVTCGRVAWLQNALYSAIHQDYQGEYEIIVFNTFPKQTLVLAPDVFNRNRVRIINMDWRPDSIGDCRNMAITAARGDLIVILDDDDYALPHHLSTYGQHFSQGGPLQKSLMGTDWLWLDKHFWQDGAKIKSIVAGHNPVFAFTKRAWEGVGGYPPLSVGEDRVFISKVMQVYRGARVPAPEMPTYIYGWNNATYHISGQGEDQKGLPKAYDRYWQELQSRVRAKKEPTGEVVLVPNMTIDWPRLSVEFMEGLKKKSEPDLRRPVGEVRGHNQHPAHPATHP